MCEEKEQFDRDGYALYRDVLDNELIAEASAHVEWLTERYPDKRPENLDHQYVRDDPFCGCMRCKSLETLRMFSARAWIRIWWRKSEPSTSCWKRAAYRCITPTSSTGRTQTDRDSGDAG